MHPWSGGDAGSRHVPSVPRHRDRSRSPCKGGKIASVQLAEMIDPGIADQNVDPSEPLDRQCDQRLAIGHLRHIGLARRNGGGARSSASACRPVLSLSPSTRVAPSFAKRRAAPSPMPEAAPVTITILPWDRAMPDAPVLPFPVGVPRPATTGAFNGCSAGIDQKRKRRKKGRQWRSMSSGSPWKDDAWPSVWRLVASHSSARSRPISRKS